METIKTRRHEIRTMASGGLGALYSSNHVNLVQCAFGISPGFDHLDVVARGHADPFDAFAEHDIYEVDMPYGREGGLMLGKRIGFFRRRFTDLSKLRCILTVSHKVDEKMRFGLAIDYISKVNVALSGEGFMVALMNNSGKVLEVLDHLADEECAYEAQKFLYDAALLMETEGQDISFQDTEAG